MSYTAIGWQRWLIYGGISLAGIVAAIVGLVVADDFPGRITVVVAAGAFVVITCRLFGPRIAYGKGIAWYTSQGLAVLPNGAPIRADSLNRAVEASCDWWSGKYPEHEQSIRDYLSGGEVKVLVQDTPLVDHRYGIRARGLTSGNSTVILWQPQDQGKDFLALVRHEIGHMCLSAMGVAQEHHHERMRMDGCPDA